VDAAPGRLQAGEPSFGAHRLRDAQQLTEREYDEMMANAPKFGWAGLRERVMAHGAGEDDELVKTCREHEAIDAGATKGVKQ
jgi:hypothetical protein